MKPAVVFLVGPTAVGKTRVACALAKKLNAEIISCDSMQIYKGMDTVTSKPQVTLRKEVPHHLFDIISPTEEYNVSRYRTDAIRKVKDIIRSKKTPLIVGGTGLYMSMLIEGIFKTRAQNEHIRRRLYEEAHKLGSAYLYEWLKKVDPAAAIKIHPNDTKRIIRALEVLEITGKPISELQKQRNGLGSKYDVKIFCLNMQRDKLYKRIDDRVERMFAQGVVREVKQLLKLKLSKTAGYAIGIRELRGYFDGEYDLAGAKQLIKRNTRLYAKRQLTWFRKDKRIEWVKVGDKESYASVANRIFQKIQRWNEHS